MLALSRLGSSFCVKAEQPSSSRPARGSRCLESRYVCMYACMYSVCSTEPAAALDPGLLPPRQAVVACMNLLQCVPCVCAAPGAREKALEGKGELHSGSV